MWIVCEKPNYVDEIALSNFTYIYQYLNIETVFSELWL